MNSHQWSWVSPPSIDDMGVCVLDPPKALPQWPFHLTLHSVHFVPSNPLLPLQFWVTNSPAFWGWPNTAFPFLHLHLLYYLVILLCSWTCIIHTVRPQILHACWGTSISIVALNLHHPPIPTWLRSEILHVWEHKQAHTRIWEVQEWMRELNGVGRKRKRKIKEKKKACWVCFSFLCCVLNYNYFIVTTFCYIYIFFL